jgi:hypothetical protein
MSVIRLEYLCGVQGLLRASEVKHKGSYCVSESDFYASSDSVMGGLKGPGWNLFSA